MPNIHKVDFFFPIPDRSSLNSKPFSAEEARALPTKFSNMTTDIEERIRAEINKSKHRTLSYEEIGDRRVFVIGDVHGCLEELVDLLKTADVDTKNDVIISVGDILNKVCNLTITFLLNSFQISELPLKQSTTPKPYIFSIFLKPCETESYWVGFTSVVDTSH